VSRRCPEALGATTQADFFAAFIFARRARCAAAPLPPGPLPSLSPSVFSGQPRFLLFQQQTPGPDALSLSRMPLRKLRALHRPPSSSCSADHALSSTSALRHLGSSFESPSRGIVAGRLCALSEMAIYRQLRRLLAAWITSGRADDASLIGVAAMRSACASLKAIAESFCDSSISNSSVDGI
jgi:hypothetical protein